MDTILSLQTLDSVILDGCERSTVSCTSDVSCKSTQSSVAGT